MFVLNSLYYDYKSKRGFPEYLCQQHQSAAHEVIGSLLAKTVAYETIIIIARCSTLEIRFKFLNVNFNVL